VEALTPASFALAVQPIFTSTHTRACAQRALQTHRHRARCKQPTCSRVAQWLAPLVLREQGAHLALEVGGAVVGLGAEGHDAQHAGPCTGAG